MMASRAIVLGVLGLVVGAACAEATPPESEVLPAKSGLFGATNVDPRRSLAVTEQPILARFAFKRVMDQLVAQSGVSGLTSLKLFRQWWDVMNPQPGLGQGPHCDDQTDPALGPVLNSFPFTCRPAPSEGAQATCDPFASGGYNTCAYVPIGLFNRFDIAPENGTHCGEYRIVYA